MKKILPILQRPCRTFRFCHLAHKFLDFVSLLPKHLWVSGHLASPFSSSNRTPQVAITIFLLELWQFTAWLSFRLVGHHWWPSLTICSNAQLATPGFQLKIVLFYSQKCLNHSYGAEIARVTLKLRPQSAEGLCRATFDWRTKKTVVKPVSNTGIHHITKIYC